ncbi:BnaCnng35490D [Brassica napus]|uniref:BnaCnng35490D protein n=1 Tax=Brassica napus TaxID=3708 RepID=A0A078J8L1_BRANA|nr:BnaCnng35490D [Brassica napus]
MRSRICNGSPRVNGLKSSSIAIPLRSSLLRRSAAKTYVLKSVTEDIKEKIPYVALDYEQEVETAKSSSAIKVMLRTNILGSFSPCRRHFMLQKLKNMKNYNNYLEECRSEDEAVQFYFQRLTMTTMLRRVVKSRSQKTQGFQNITDKFMELSTKLLTARSAC